MKIQGSLPPSVTGQDTNGNHITGVTSSRDLATNTEEVPLASYINPNMIPKGAFASWIGNSSALCTEYIKKYPDNSANGHHPLEAEPVFLINPPAARASDGPEVVEDRSFMSFLQLSNSLVLTAMKRKAESDMPEVKKHQKSAELLSEAPPSSPNIRQSKCSTQEAVSVDNGDDFASTGPPTNDLEGALRSLRGWLSTEAIQRVLEVCADSSDRILDGAYLSAALFDQNDEPPIRLQPHERTVIAPICF
ncbi:MAG: hypothetical protein Q9166_005331 [cf. Caloplaca sp. 2 TL-2023]